MRQKPLENKGHYRDNKAIIKTKMPQGNKMVTGRQKAIGEKRPLGRQ